MESAEQETDALPFESPLLQACYGASIQGRVGLGEKKGSYVHRAGRVANSPFYEFTGERCAKAGGFSLHANVFIHGRKRKRLERICRYAARNAIATERLERLADGRVCYRLRRAYSDGTKAIVFDPLVFIEKLCALVPPPRQNLVTYFGVFAPNAAFRDQVVVKPRPAWKRTKPVPLEEAGENERRRRYTFSELMRRVFEIDVLVCPRCQGKRKLIAMITETPVIRAILSCLKLPVDPPVLAGPRGSPGLFFD